MPDEAKAVLEAEAAAATLAQEAEAKSIEGLEKDELLKLVAKLNQESAGRRVANKELQDKIDAGAEATAKLAREAAEKNGEFEGLYQTATEEAKNASGQVKTLTATLQKMLDAEVALIPENMRALVPAGDVSVALEWIATAKAAKLFVTENGTPPRVPGEENSGTLEAQYAEAEKAGNVSLMMQIKAAQQVKH